MKNDKEELNETKKNPRKKSRLKRISDRFLLLTLYIVLILLISMVSFGGVYVKNKNTTINKVKEYTLGDDLVGLRNIIIKVDDSTETKKYDANGNEVTEETTSEEQTETTTKEVPVNDESILNKENFDKVRKIVEDRIKYIGIDLYEIKYNETDGTISIDVPDNDMADYVAQYAITKGEFKISDNDTDEVLMNNSDIKDVSVKYYTQSTGTTVYLDIKFNNEGKKKLKEISNTYVVKNVEQETEKETDETEEQHDEEDQQEETKENEETKEESNEESPETTTVEKKIKMTLDDSNIITTSFDEEITNGEIQLTMGTSTDKEEIKEYLEQGSNIALLLNSDVLPIKYKLDTNNLVYSSISQDSIKSSVIVLASICIVLFIYMIIKYKKYGVISVISNIGFVALLGLSIRYANVKITLSGLYAIFGSALLDYVFLFNLLRKYTADTDEELKEKEIKKVIRNSLEILIPITVISVVFALNSWQQISSAGMILFWSVLELIICNLVSVKIICKKEGK